MEQPAISIDLGGSHATIAIVRGASLVASHELAMDSAKDLRPSLKDFAATIHRLSAQAQVSIGDCAGVALGFCGLADARTGRVLSTNKKYEDAPSIDFTVWSLQEFGLPFRIENDARMALLGERQVGAAQGCDNVVMITLGTGIGGAAMIEGKLLRGKHGQAGCLGGHLLAKVGGRLCTCGAVGCMEAEASGWALPVVAKEWNAFAESGLSSLDRIDFQSVFALAEDGDKVAHEILQYCLEVWASATVSLIHAYDPERIVIGGGIMRSADVILPHIQAYADRHAWTPWGKVEITAAKLGNNAGLFGAIPLLTEIESSQPSGSTLQ